MQKYPETTALFANVNGADVHSPEFRAHGLRVANGIRICIYALHNPEVLTELTSHLATQHAAIDGINVEYFDVSRFTMLS